MTFRLLKATDVKNVEAGLGGKVSDSHIVCQITVISSVVSAQSDPYVRVMMHGVIKARTDVVNNSTYLRTCRAVCYSPISHFGRLES